MVLRWFFLTALATSVADVLTRAQWECQVRCGNTTRVFEQPRAPVWDAPALPSYDRLARSCSDLPLEATPRVSVRQVFKWDWTLLDLLPRLWANTILFSLVYLATRSERRDFVLHCGLGVSIGLTVCALDCIGLWLIAGSRGLPSPEMFGLGGVVAGLAGSFLTWGSMGWGPDD
jgi:hypothetical protein